MRRILIVFLAVFLTAGLSASADDLTAPPWRGQDGSTHQEWNFPANNNTNMPTPDAVDNEYGPPLLMVDTPHQWLDLVDGRDGVWPLSGEIDVYIPNQWEIPQPEKHIWIQLTWASAAGQPIDPKLFVPFEPVVGIAPFETMEMTRSNTDLNGWTHSLFEVIIRPNPPEEYITIKGNILVDQLVIDTICIPEPATIALLGTGALVTFSRRRRTI